MCVCECIIEDNSGGGPAKGRRGSGPSIIAAAKRMRMLREQRDAEAAVSADWAAVIERGIHEYYADLLVGAIRSDPRCYAAAKAYFEDNPVLALVDICCGSSGWLFLLERLPARFAAIGIQFKVEVLFQSDIDKWVHTFGRLYRPLPSPSDEPVPMFGAVQDIVRRLRKGEKMLDHRSGQLRSIPRTGSDGSHPFVVSGIECGPLSNANNFRGQGGSDQSTQQTIEKGSKDSKTAATWFGTLDLLVELDSKDMLVENSPNVEGAKHPLSTTAWTSMKETVRNTASGKWLAELQRLDSPSFQHRERAYMQFSEGAEDTKGIWAEFLTVLVDAVHCDRGQLKDDIHCSLMDRQRASQCPYIQQFPDWVRQEIRYTSEITNARPYYMGVPGPFPPVLDRDQATYGIPSAVWCGGLSGFCERALLVLHWTTEIKDAFALAKFQTVATVQLQQSISRNKHHPAIYDRFPTICEHPEWFMFVPGGNRAGVASIAEHFALMGSPLVDLGVDIAEMASQIPYRHATSLAGRGFYSVCAVEGILAKCLTRGEAILRKRTAATLSQYA